MLENKIEILNLDTVLDIVLTMGRTLELDKECLKFAEALINIGYTHVKIFIKDGENCKYITLPDNTPGPEIYEEKFKIKLNGSFSREIKGIIEVHKQVAFTVQERKYISFFVRSLEKTLIACLYYEEIEKEIRLRKKAEKSLDDARKKIRKLTREKQKLTKELETQVKEHSEKFEEIIGQLREIALKDSMTGLYNRRQILILGEEAFKNSLTYGKDFAAIMLDIDDFKMVNDTYGHLIGDKVIEVLGKRLKNTVKDKDLIGRYGGEEFVLFLYCDKEAAEKVGERIRKVVSDRDFIIGDGVRLQITVSLGVAIRTDETKSLYSLLEKADKMLYVAKTTGKNKVVIS